MKNNAINLISAFLLIIILPGFLLIQTMRNSKSCGQFVIDSYELLSGIDIPKQRNSKCFYIEEERLRVGVYTLNSPREFIENYQLKKLDGDRKKPLWSQGFLMDEGDLLPVNTNTLFHIGGEKKGNQWQCMVEEDTGRMWMEVKWKE